MASAAHCIGCFEALDAHLKKRKPLSLEDIEASWDNYSRSKLVAPKLPALARLAAPGDSSLPVSSSSSISSSSTPNSGDSASTPATSTSSLSFASVARATASTSTPLFVTWNTFDNDDDDDDETSLRGCIGTFEPLPLSSGISEYALIAALHDTRFSPISRRELSSLQVAVTLLTDFEEVDDPYDWVVGTHGIRLSFHDRGRRYGSTYLPDVASEQGWSKEEALFSLTRKAGWMGSHSRWEELDLKVTRYQGKKHEMAYKDFKKWQEWVESAQSEGAQS